MDIFHAVTGIDDLQRFNAAGLSFLDHDRRERIPDEAGPDLAAGGDDAGRFPHERTQGQKRALPCRLLCCLTRAPFTPYTITDVQELMQELDACRENGYAIENGEYKIGLRSISAPVYTVEGEVRYTVGVIGMFRSIHSDEFLAAVSRVQDTARMISTALGYRKQEEPI